MSICKICKLELVASEEAEKVCYSCDNKSPSERQAILDRINGIKGIEKKEKEKPVTKIKTYSGKKEEAAKKLENDAISMAAEGYFPVSQSYEPGTWGCGAFIVALLLCLVLIGLIVFIYMLIVKPDGTLTVIYELKNRMGNETHKEKPEDNVNYSEDKICPECAETIKAAARICRFCRYEFN